MNCPRDDTPLTREALLGIEIDRCGTCRGQWLDNDELDKLEQTTGATDEERRATITFGERKSELKCPVCGKVMTVFQYRAHAVEIEMCPDEHGYWLDEGEEKRVREIVLERVRDLGRAASAEAGWRGFLGGLRRSKKR